VNDKSDAVCKGLSFFHETCRVAGVEVVALTGDSLSVCLPTPTAHRAYPFDLCFVDTWHAYGQTKRELTRYAPLTRKYIVLHDTTIDAEVSESVREGLDMNAQMRETGFTPYEVETGIWPAVEEFLQSSVGTWTLGTRHRNNNGLTILIRCTHTTTTV
jgi:hypothetical protein